MDKEKMKKNAQDLIDFLYESPTSYHAVENTEKVLLEKGYTKLCPKDRWSLDKGRKYYVTSNDSALIAFETGNGDTAEKGFRIIGAHTDSPTFKIKPNGGMISEGSYVKLNTEVYGGPIFSTWYDRPLSVAGKVVLKGKNIMEPEERLLKVNRPILVIPNIAIHFNREVNNGYKYNPQVDTLPLLSLVNKELEKEDYLLNLIAEELQVHKKDIIDFELFLFEYEKGCIMGLCEEFISSSRLDDLWMVYAGLEALVNSDQRQTEHTKVLICVDHEEVGSGSAHGAASLFIRNTLKRISIALGMDEEDFLRSMASSMTLSCDLAHAVHPNLGEKHDPSNRPVLGSGPVLKYSSKQLYITTGKTASVFTACCEKAKVPVQKFVNRSDAVGGSTIAKFLSANLCMDVVDLGTPILGMHSIRELGAVCDHYYITEAFKAFYNA